jgi:hypothetical protein
MKVILNKCFGGFGVSEMGIRHCREKGAAWAQWPNSYLKGEFFSEDDGSPSAMTCDSAWVAEGREAGARECPHLIALIESGAYKDDHCSRLKVVEIPDGVTYEIDDYDGQESIGQPRTVWG